jgi:hypothetical protein
MTRFVVGDDRSQSTLFPERLEDYLSEDNPVRAIDVFVDELDLAALGFGGVEPEATGRPAYHPATLLKIYVYGYLNRVQSSRRLESSLGRDIVCHRHFTVEESRFLSRLRWALHSNDLTCPQLLKHHADPAFLTPNDTARKM